MTNPGLLKPGGVRDPEKNDWQLWLGCPGVPVLSAKTGVVLARMATDAMESTARTRIVLDILFKLIFLM